jgi:hypothetical protein
MINSHPTPHYVKFMLWAGSSFSFMRGNVEETSDMINKYVEGNMFTNYKTVRPA